MAASSAISLQQRLESCAVSVGYTGRIRGVPKEALRNRKVVHFLQWAVDHVSASHTFTQAQLDKYEELRKAGVILEGVELRETLSKVEGSEDQPIEQISAEVSSLQTSVSALKAQLQSLNSIQKNLSDHHACLVRERESLSHTHSHTQHAHRAALHTARDDNTKVNAALGELQTAVDSVATFHQPPDGKEGDRAAEPSLLSQLPASHYTSAEDHYLAELTAYTKKQFFQGIAVMAHTPEDTQCGVVDLDDPGNILMKGNSNEQYRRHCQELSRLKSLYPVVEAQRVSDVLAEQHAVAVCRKAEELLTQLQQSSPPPDATLLRQHITNKQTHLSQLQSEMQRLARGQLPGLIQETATLQVSKVLHGDYSLKIARQDYFTSKQDKVISHLLAQTSRQELLSMLYELELRRHRDTHRLLSAASSQLHSWRTERERRTQAMQSGALLPVKETRQTIDSRDQFASRMCSILGVGVSGGAAPLLTHSKLERAVKQLTQQATSLEALLSALENEQLHVVQETVAMSDQLGRQAFGCTGTGKPELSLKEYEEECTKLESLLSAIEQNIKKLLSDFDAKKKALQGNQLIERERKLFVYFFTDPRQLSRELAELARRVDAVAVAQQSS